MLLSRRQAALQLSAAALTFGTATVARADIPRVERIRARVQPELSCEPLLRLGCPG